ncbi:hypothetical protein C0995_004996, partial [Termitomyces sp. Mi166
MAIKLKPPAPVVVPKTVMDLAPTPASATLSIQCMPSISYVVDPFSPPCIVVASGTEESPCYDKGKAKATEEDEDKEGEAAQKLRKELENFVVLTKCDQCIADNLADQCWYPTGKCPCWCCCHKSKSCLWNGVGVRMQKKHPPLKALVIAKCIKLVQAAKAFLEQQGKLLQFFVLEGFKEKGKAKALLVDSEPMGAKQAFKLTGLVNSDSNKEEEEEKSLCNKKIKCEHVEEPIGMRKEKEIIELEDLEDEMVAPKIPTAEPLCQTLKPMVLVSSMPKPVSKPIVTQVAAGKVTSVATQETLQDKDTGDKNDNNRDRNDDDDESGKGNNDNSNNDNDAAMGIDSSRHPEETWPTAPTKVMVTEVIAPVPVP